MSKTDKSISNEVLAQIKEGQVHMHPDWYFALLTTGFAIALACTLGVAIYALNLFWLRLEIAREGVNPWLLGRYYLDVQHLPVIFIMVAVLAVGGVVYLLQHRSQYARKLPEWSIALGVLVFVTCLGLAFSRTGLNRPLRQGPLHQLYEQQEDQPGRRIPLERNEGPAL